MKTIMALSFGIVNYNGGDYLIDCVKSIKNQKNITSSIFVYDNASSDDSIVKLQEFFLGDVNIIQAKENKGYAFACNRLIEVITDSYFVLCNMDIIFDDNFGDIVYDFTNKNPTAQSFSPLFIHQNSGLINWAGTKFYKDLHPFSFLSDASLENVPSQKITFGCYGAVMIFHRNLFDTVGYFDEDYFLFYEETDFYFRTELLGIPTYFLPKAKVYHYRSLSTVRFSTVKLFYGERNRIVTAFKYLPIFKFPIIFWYSCLRFYFTKKQLPKEKSSISLSSIDIILIIFKAWISAIMLLPKTYKKRKLFWSKVSEASPKKTISLLKKYSVSLKDLKL